jgi:hypothetical protein
MQEIFLGFPHEVNGAANRHVLPRKFFEIMEDLIDLT